MVDPELFYADVDPTFYTDPDPNFTEFVDNYYNKIFVLLNC